MGLMCACSGQSSKRESIPEETLQEILKEMYMTQAYVARHYRELDLPVDSSFSLTANIIHRHHFTEAVFDSTLYAYAKNPKRFNRLIEKVLESLSYDEQLAMREDSLVRALRMMETSVLQDSLRRQDSLQFADYVLRGQGESRLLIPSLLVEDQTLLEEHRRLLKDWLQRMTLKN